MLILSLLVCGAVAAGTAAAPCTDTGGTKHFDRSGSPVFQRIQYQQYQSPYASPQQSSLPGGTSSSSCSGYTDPAARTACLNNIGSAQQLSQQYQQTQQSMGGMPPGQQAPSTQQSQGQAPTQQQQLLQQLQQSMASMGGLGGMGPMGGGSAGALGGGQQQQSSQGSDAEMRMRMMLLQRSMQFGGIFGGSNGIIAGFMKGNGSSNSNCTGYNEYAAKRACENGDLWAAQRIEGHEASGSETDWYNR
jgi:hypothetical protein